MKARTALALLVVCAALVGGMVWFRTMRKPVEKLPPGSVIFPDFPVNDIAKVTLSDPSGSLTIEKKENSWIVPACHGYHADFNRLSALLCQVMDLKVGQKHRVREASLGKMKLLGPDDKGSTSNQQGTVLSFFSKGGACAAMVIVGTDQAGADEPTDPYSRGREPGSQFIRVPSRGSDVIGIKEPFDLDKTPENWIERTICNVPNSEIRSVTVTSPDASSYSLSRTNQQMQFDLPGLCATQQVKASDVGGLGSALSSLTINEVVAPSIAATNTALDKPWKLVLRAFDGRIYTLTVSDTNQPKVYLKLAAAYEKPAEPVTTNVSESGTSPYQAEDTAKRTNERLGPWTFVISDYKANQMRTPLKDVVEPKPLPQPPVPATTAPEATALDETEPEQAEAPVQPAAPEPVSATNAVPTPAPTPAPTNAAAPQAR